MHTDGGTGSAKMANSERELLSAKSVGSHRRRYPGKERRDFPYWVLRDPLTGTMSFTPYRGPSAG